MVKSRRLEINGPVLVFITTTITNWIPVFENKKYAELVVMQLDETAKYFKNLILGYIVMPSHVHLLIGMSDYSTLSKFMQSFKSITSRKLKDLITNEYLNSLKVNGKYQLWQRRFDDLVIYSEKQFKIKLDYIHNNPIKDGLIENPIDWQYSSALDWLSNKDGLIKIDKDYSWLNLEYS